MPALPIGAAGKKFRNLTIFMHFQGQNLNFLVKNLIFYQKIATSNVQNQFYLVQIFTGFLLIFGQISVISKSVKSVKKTSKISNQ